MHPLIGNGAYGGGAGQALGDDAPVWVGGGSGSGGAYDLPADPPGDGGKAGGIVNGGGQGGQGGNGVASPPP
ncbi:hypothetical protein H7J50_21670 [Mycobacterium intermedium]|uniref:hypothetical protein n=1 Tax=Mycobacterium intermedium TaxID=28445 RepID=UPI0012EAB503|nr:hypothetical protein [Mycobacterium intermedium]MCV6966395.1 hypothetical protein [Mycobacterium intermedium]